MDLNKVGKFIAENRNLQSLTQKDLGEFLNINPKTVSKWERGVNAPDIALLTELAKYLNVSVEEILAGERIKKKKFAKKFINKIFNKSNKTLKIVSITFIIFAIFTIGGLFFHKYILNNQKSEVYKISTDNEDYSVSGYLFLNKDEYLVDITEIKSIERNIGRSSNVKFIHLEVNFVSDGEIIHNYSIKDSGEFDLFEELRKIDFKFKKKQENPNDILNIKNEMDIKYCTSDTKCSLIKIDLDIEKS